MKIRIWLKVAQTSPLGLIKEIILLSLGPGFPRTVHFTLLHFYTTTCSTLYLLKHKKNINHLYAFRKEQYIKNHFHYHCHNHYHHRYHHQ